MQHARELLGRTGLSVAEIGQSVGYADYYNFEKMFKKKTGTSPGIFRKEGDVFVVSIELLAMCLS